MTRRSKQCAFLVGTASIFLVALFAPLGAAAREGYFRPAQGEALAGSPGEEVASVSEEGSVSLFSATGEMLPGFPVFLDGQVAASSPVIARVFGQSSKEIVFLSRNASYEYALNAYDGAGSLVGSAAIGAGDIFCDPVAADIAGTAKRGIVIVRDDGSMAWARETGGVLTVAEIANLGAPACAAWNGETKELIVNYPTQSYIDVYKESGLVWSRVRRVAVLKPLLYAITPAGASAWYGIDADNNAVALNPQTGALLTGFPAALNASALASPVLSDADASQEGLELSVPVVGGKTVVLNTSGTLLDASFAQGPADDVQVLSADKPSGILFVIRAFALRIIGTLEERIASIFGSIRRLLPSDLDGPMVSGVATDRSAIMAGEPLTLTAQAEDGASTIAAAEYHVRANGDESPVVGGYGAAMQSADGTFDANIEQVTAEIDTGAWTAEGSPYTIHVLAKDAKGNWSAASAMATVTVNSPPIASMHFDESAGCSASGGESMTGTLGPNCSGGNAPSWTASGLSNSALSFDGVDDKVTFSATSTFNPGSGSFSVSVWVKILATQGNQTGLVGSVGSSDYFIFELSGTKMFYEIRDNLGAADRFAAWGNTPLSMNAWNHLVYVINRENNTINLYLNGVLDKSIPAAIDEPILPNGALFVGRHVHVLNGAMDELALYNRAVSAEEVRALYDANARSAPDTLTLTFNQGSGCAITEQEGFYGTLGPACASGNAPLWTTDAVSSAALSFDGVDDKVTFNSSPTFNPGTGSFSVSVWVKPTGSQGNQTGLVGSVGQSDYFIFELSGTNMFYEIRDNGGAGDRFFGWSAKTLTMNAWNHLVYVINRENNTIDLYLNGVLDKSIPAVIDEPILPNGVLFVGRHVHVLNGAMDELALYNRAVSAEEVRALYDANARSAPDTPAFTFNQGSGCAITEQEGFYGTLGPDCPNGNAPQWSTDAVSSTALSFDGVDDKVTFNANSVFNPGTGSFSASLWVKPMGTQGNQTGLVGSVGQSDYFIFELSGTKMFYEIRDNLGAADRFAAWGNTPLSMNAWNHLVYVINRETSTIDLYLNGVLDKSIPAAMDEPIEPNGVLFIGRHVQVLNGGMDELRLYHRALTPSDVAALYAGGGG